MSRGKMLRALVNERLAAAAEDIFVLFERTIAEYEEELHRSKENKSFSPWIEPVRRDVLTNPCPGLNQENTETLQIKEEAEEQIVKQEEEQLPVPVPESSAVCVKTEESSLLQQRETEHREETQEENISSEPRFHSETEGHSQRTTYTDWTPFSWSSASMETNTDRDCYNQVQTRDRSNKVSPQNKCPLETTVHSEHMSGAHGGAAERKKHQCPFCNKIFGTKRNLKLHIRVHTGEKPYGCSICGKKFTQKSHLNSHIKTHSRDKAYSCSMCEKTFTQKCQLKLHTRIHTGDKPFSCTD